VSLAWGSRRVAVAFQLAGRPAPSTITVAMFRVCGSCGSFSYLVSSGVPERARLPNGIQRSKALVTAKGGR
jgi:hypothetical protein